MTLPMDQSPSSYVVFRNAPLGQPYDPTVPPEFFPAKDSDELFDALRAKFPLHRSHSERMREAMIEFLIEERQAERMSTATCTSPTLPSETAVTSPWQQSWASVSSGTASSTVSSPETAGLATPTSGYSPQPAAPSLARQTSKATSELSPPALDHMTSVFSLSSDAQPITHVRRKMTEQEKIQYRKRRIVKACEKCSKRKRKCTHNQPDMETVNSSKASKISKSSRSGVPKQLPGTGLVFEPDIPDLGDYGAFQSPDDFSYMLEDTLPELDFDDDTILFDSQMLFQSTSGGRTHALQEAAWQGAPEQCPLANEWGLQVGTDPICSFEATVGGSELVIDELFQQSRFDNDTDVIGLGDETRLATMRNVHQHASVSNARQCSGQHSLLEIDQAVPRDAMLWEPLHTGKIEATHTRHTHDSQYPSGAAGIEIDQSTGTVAQLQGSAPSQPQQQASKSSQPRNYTSWDEGDAMELAPPACNYTVGEQANTLDFAAAWHESTQWASLGTDRGAEAIDHVRYRDHHGRRPAADAAVLPWTTIHTAQTTVLPHVQASSQPPSHPRFADVAHIAAMASLLLTLATLLAAGVPPSLLVLALCTPQPGAKGYHFRTRIWDFISQCFADVAPRCWTACRWPGRHILRLAQGSAPCQGGMQWQVEADRAQRKWRVFGSAVGFVA